MGFNNHFFNDGIKSFYIAALVDNPENKNLDFFNDINI